MPLVYWDRGNNLVDNLTQKMFIKSKTLLRYNWCLLIHMEEELVNQQWEGKKRVQILLHLVIYNKKLSKMFWIIIEEFLMKSINNNIKFMEVLKNNRNRDLLFIQLVDKDQSKKRICKLLISIQLIMLKIVFKVKNKIKENYKFFDSSNWRENLNIIINLIRWKERHTFKMVQMIFKT